MPPWIISFITGPFIKLGLGLYKEKLAGTNNHEKIVENLAIRSMELDQREARLNNDRKSDINGKWYVPENLFAYTIALPYWFTAITMDFLVFPALGIEHATNPLKGDTAVAMTMIMTFWLGKRALTGVASIIAGAFGKK